MQFFRIILIIILVYYLIKLSMRLLIPLLARYIIRKANQSIYDRESFESTSAKKGKVQAKPDSGNVGEYVDYEEIKE